MEVEKGSINLLDNAFDRVFLLQSLTWKDGYAVNL